MSLFQSAVVLFYVILFIISAYSCTFAAPIEMTKVTSVSKDLSCYHYIMTALLLLADMDDMDGGQKKTRVKRDTSRSGKYQDAALMGIMKVFQLGFTMFRNIFAEEPVGGRHPLARGVPGPVVLLFKESIINNLYPKPAAAE